MAVGNPTGLWRRTADFSIRHARAILVVAAVVTLGLGSAMFEIETDTDLNGFIRPEARELADEIEAHFDEGGQLNLIFESRSDRSLLEPELLHKQLRIIQALKERYRVTTFSLVEGIDAGLKRVKRKSLLDYDEYTPIAEGILGLGRGAHGSRSRKGEPPHGLAPEAISFYAKLRIASAMGVTMEGPGARETTYGTPYVKAIRAFARLDSGYSDEKRRRILDEIPSSDPVHGRTGAQCLRTKRPAHEPGVGSALPTERPGAGAHRPPGGHPVSLVPLPEPPRAARRAHDPCDRMRLDLRGRSTARRPLLLLPSRRAAHPSRDGNRRHPRLRPSPGGGAHQAKRSSQKHCARPSRASETRSP